MAHTVCALFLVKPSFWTVLHIMCTPQLPIVNGHPAFMGADININYIQ